MKKKRRKERTKIWVKEKGEMDSGKGKKLEMIITFFYIFEGGGELCYGI